MGESPKKKWRRAQDLDYAQIEARGPAEPDGTCDSILVEFTTPADLRLHKVLTAVAVELLMMEKLEPEDRTKLMNGLLRASMRARKLRMAKELER